MRPTDPYYNQDAASRLGSEADKLREQTRALDVVKMKLTAWGVSANVECGHAALDDVQDAINSISDAMSTLGAAITALNDDAGDLDREYEPQRSIGGGV